VQVVTTVLKILPLLVLAAALLPHSSAQNLTPFAPKGLGALFPAISFIAWLFLGMESITVPAEEVQGSGQTIRRSAYAGYALACAVYLLVGFSVVLGMPASAIAGSDTPLAIAASRVLGEWGVAFVTLGALVSIAGVLNGWLLVAGRLPFAAAREGFAPRWLAAIHPRTGTPVPGLLVSSAVAAALVLLYFSGTLLRAYNLVALASTATALVAVGGACAAQIALLRREPERFPPAQRRRGPFTAAAGILAVAVVIYGCEANVQLVTLAIVVLLVPAYFWVRRGQPG
jgi:APA family basic amino acid/polyamine antiporter